MSLTENEIKMIVKDTIHELLKSGYLKQSDDIAYAEISDRLFEHFKHPERDPELCNALDSIKNDHYYKVITLYYRDRYTIDWIAEEFNCEVSTITRNKKRLCLKLHEKSR